MCRLGFKLEPRSLPEPLVQRRHVCDAPYGARRKLAGSSIAATGPQGIVDGRAASELGS